MPPRRRLETKGGTARRRLAACTLSVAVFAAWPLGREVHPSRASRPASVRAPVPLRKTPVWVRDACGGFGLSMRRYCPAAVPAADSDELTMSIVFAGRGRPANLLQLLSGSESAGNQRANRPPHLLGLLLGSGDVGRALSGLLPPAGAAPARARDGLVAAARRSPLALGRRRWAGHAGELALAPSSGPVPLAYFRYVFFRWRDSRGSHVLGLRAWEPFTESVRTLHALVDRLAPAPQRRFAYPARRGPGGVATARAPDWLLAACHALRTRPICPGRIPATPRSSLDLFLLRNAGPSRHGRQDWISAEWGTPYESEPARNRPPRFVHLDIRAGGVPLGRRFRHPVTRPRDGLFRSRGRQPIPLGRPRWVPGGGILVLGDCFANHLCFRWRRHGVGYQIDLHGWEPFSQTVATLHAIVSSIRSPSAK
jgi:hypothetical protein